MGKVRTHILENYNYFIIEFSKNPALTLRDAKQMLQTCIAVDSLFC